MRVTGFLESILSVILLCEAVKCEQYHLRVDASEVVSPLHRFWRSTGFCPPLPHENFNAYVLSDDELQNIALIGSVARRGIEQVRIHWLFDLVTVKTESSDGLTYDFSDLDTLLDRLHRSQLRPGFELMGNPSSYFTTFDNKTQVALWKDLVYQTAVRYISRYGLAEVAQWNFETWNEPSNGDFDTLKVTIQGFLNYYDACSEGLLAAHASLRLGGPGDGCRSTQAYCWAFLAHCANGTNFFTGKTGVRVDFISFHHKGHSSSDYILQSSNDTIYYIRAQYPQLAHVDIYNDEADPLVGWSKPEDWRADMRYAAMVVRVIAEHQDAFLSTPSAANFTRYALLSNDNGFMNWDPISHFNERTLTTRFRMNMTSPRSVEMVKKPVLAVMSLLALLGGNQVQANFDPKPRGMGLGVLATSHTPNASDPSDSWELVVLVYNSDDALDETDIVQLSLEVINLPETSTAPNIQYYSMNDEQTNPFGVWSDAQSPVYPKAELFASMRAQQEPQSMSIGVADASIGTTTARNRPVLISIEVKLPGVNVLHICQAATNPPPQVTGVFLHNVTSSEVLVAWHGVDVRCLATYEVLFSINGTAGVYTQANPTQLLISSSYIHALPAEVLEKMASQSVFNVSYKIVAVDYSGRKGPPSGVVSITL